MPYLIKETKPKSFHKTFYKPYLTFSIQYLLKKESKNAKQKLRQYIKLCPYNTKAYFLLLLTLIPFDLRSRLTQVDHTAKSLGSFTPSSAVDKQTISSARSRPRSIYEQSFIKSISGQGSALKDETERLLAIQDILLSQKLFLVCLEVLQECNNRV